MITEDTIRANFAHDAELRAIFERGRIVLDPANMRMVPIDLSDAGAHVDAHDYNRLADMRSADATPDPEFAEVDEEPADSDYTDAEEANFAQESDEEESEVDRLHRTVRETRIAHDKVVLAARQTEIERRIAETQRDFLAAQLQGTLVRLAGSYVSAGLISLDAASGFVNKELAPVQAHINGLAEPVTMGKDPDA